MSDRTEEVYVRMRLDKFLSERTAYSRSQLKSMIAAGKVSVNGVSSGIKADTAVTEQDEIRLQGEIIRQQRTLTVLLHKPAGYVSATEDDKEATVMELLPAEYQGQNLFPVGRLDKDTTGLLLLTNDGDLAHRLLSPKKHVPKYYIAHLARPFTEEACQQFAAGITLANGETCRPAEAACLTDDGMTILVCLHEGKYHQVKRMTAAVGSHVERLHRVGMGGLLLPANLPVGSAIALLDKELGKVLNDRIEFSSFCKMMQNYLS